jgi:hypothetical protein
MSFGAPTSFERIPLRAEIPGLPRNWDSTPNILIFHAIKARRRAEKGKFEPILKNSLLNSLLAGNLPPAKAQDVWQRTRADRRRRIVRHNFGLAAEPPAALPPAPG